MSQPTPPIEQSDNAKFLYALAARAWGAGNAMVDIDATRADELRDRAVRLREVADEFDAGEALNARLAALLDGVAVALRGEAPQGCAHSWADLPELAAEVIRLFHLRRNVGNAEFDAQAYALARSLPWGLTSPDHHQGEPYT